MIRRYWLPALLADEVAAADGPLVRVRLVGLELVAFRDSKGRLKLLEAGDRLGTRAFPVREAGGLVWTYLGAPGLEPPFPAFDWNALPRTHVALVKFVENTNYLQATEGAIDTAHSWFLHRGVLRDWKLRSSISMDLSPRLEAEYTN